MINREKHIKIGLFVLFLAVAIILIHNYHNSFSFKYESLREDTINTMYQPKNNNHLFFRVRPHNKNELLLTGVVDFDDTYIKINGNTSSPYSFSIVPLPSDSNYYKGKLYSIQIEGIKNVSEHDIETQIRLCLSNERITKCKYTELIYIIYPTEAK